jgi:hypothetical protein
MTTTTVGLTMLVGRCGCQAAQSRLCALRSRDPQGRYAPPAAVASGHP